MYLLGCDIGSSSVKASVVEVESGKTVGSDFFPKEEAPILAVKPGWAEQDPESWWGYLKDAIKGAIAAARIDGKEIRAIGISYQMHGLVVVDSDKRYYVLQLSGATAGRFPTETVPSQRLEKSSACLICLIRPETLRPLNLPGLKNMSRAYLSVSTR